MICHQCLRASSRAKSSILSGWIRPSRSTTLPSRTAIPLRHLTTSAPESAAAPTSSDATASATEKTGRATPANAPISISSVPAGTPLKGLNFLKGGSDPIALEDHEYPAWLWNVLKKAEKGSKDAVTTADLFAKSKKQRRLAAKLLRKQQLLNPDSLIPKVPIYEQSIDLPAGDGSVQGSVDADKARGDLTKAMRNQRRSKIKEDNFLKEMS